MVRGKVVDANSRALLLQRLCASASSSSSSSLCTPWELSARILWTVFLLQLLLVFFFFWGVLVILRARIEERLGSRRG